MYTTVLVLNMGMKSIRSILFDSDGNKIASSALPLETSLYGDRVTQNPDEWWTKAKIVIKETLSKAEKCKVDYLTVTTSAACLVCVDREGNSLLPCMMVSDRRAHRESEILANFSEFIKLRNIETDITADPYYMLPKAMWVKENEKEIFGKVHKFLSPNDYLISKFTGEYVTDYINGKKWYCDTKNKRYPVELFTQAGISIDLLPQIINPGDLVGEVIPSLCCELGLNLGTKVVASTYDAIASFVGSGSTKDGEASDVSGTVTVFRAATNNKKCCSEKIQTVPYYAAGLDIVGGSNNLGGGLIEWVKQCYYCNEELPYEMMEKDASEATLGASGLIFLPYLLGERTPIWDSEARGVFFGLERSHTRKEMTRAVFESTGYIDLDMIAAIEEVGGKVDRIKLSGGLARLNLISQIKSDITGREVQVLSEFETTSTGAAMIALYGQGVYNTIQEATDRFVKVRMIICPDNRKTSMYREMYDLYKETYTTLQPLFKRRNSIVHKLNNNTKIKIENL